MYKVLLADDEKHILMGLQLGINWSAMDCEVVACAANGKEAIELLEQIKPDILLSDISMEPMDGIEVCRYIKEHNLGTRCILMTGYHDFGKAHQAINYNVSTLLLKPTSTSDITRAFQKLIQDIQKKEAASFLEERYQIQEAENRQLKQTLLLQSILHGQVEESSIPSALLTVGIELNAFLVVTIHIKNVTDSEDLADTEDRPLLDKYLGNVFSGQKKYSFYSSRSRQHIIFPISENIEKERQQIHLKCTQLSDIIDALADYSISIGFSAYHPTASALKTALEESITAAGYLPNDAEYPIMEYGSLPTVSIETLSELQKTIGNLTSSIQKSDFAACISILDGLFADKNFTLLPFANIQSIASFILSLCIQQQILYGCYRDAISYHSNIQKRLAACSSQAEILLCLKDVIGNLACQLKDHSTSSDLMTNIKKYIQQNYASDLSLESIGRVFSISPGYLGKLFKQQEHMNISNYIQEIRIEHAKEIILHSNIHTYEIGEQVGIPDPAYFSKLFKKVTGYRVRDFKKQYVESKD